MINKILTGIFNLVISLVSTLLSPIDSLINSALPSIAEGLIYINNFFNYILGFIPYLMSWFHLPNVFITLLVGYFTFKLTVPLAIHTIKQAIAWYDKIKP